MKTKLGLKVWSWKVEPAKTALCVTHHPNTPLRLWQIVFCVIVIHPTQVAFSKKPYGECPTWLALCRGLCSRVHASYFCVKLKLSPHGQLVASCRAPWEPLPQHPFIPSTSLHITFIDSYQFSRSESLLLKFVLRPWNRPSVDLGEPAFNQDTSRCTRSN